MTMHDSPEAPKRWGSEKIARDTGELAAQLMNGSKRIRALLSLAHEKGADLLPSGPLQKFDEGGEYHIKLLEMLAALGKVQEEVVHSAGLDNDSGELKRRIIELDSQSEL